MQTSDASTLQTPAQRDAAARGLKVLMPVDAEGRPFLHHALARLAEAGCEAAVLVVPPDHEEVRATLARWPSPLPTRLAVQDTPRGTADAVAVGAAAIPDDVFLVVNGDNLYPVAAIRTLLGMEGCALGAFSRASLERESGFTPSRVAAFAAIDVDGDGWLTRLHEKPPVEALAPSMRVSVNLWRLDRAVAAACRDVAASPRGERELPDAVQLAVARGTRVRVVDVGGAVLDLTSAADVDVVSRAVGRPEARG